MKLTKGLLFVAIGLAILAGSFQLRSPSPITAESAQAHDPTLPIVIESCDGVLAKLNSLHPHDVVADVEQCQIVTNKVRIKARFVDQICTQITGYAMTCDQNTTNVQTWVSDIGQRNTSSIRDISYIFSGYSQIPKYIPICPTTTTGSYFTDPWNETAWTCQSSSSDQPNSNGFVRTVKQKFWLTAEPVPTIALTASPTSVPPTGAPVTFTWTSTWMEGITFQLSSDYDGLVRDNLPSQGSTSVTVSSGGLNILEKTFSLRGERGSNSYVYNTFATSNNAKVGFSPGKPDLVPDTSGMRISTKAKDNYTATYDYESYPAAVGYDLVSITVSGLKIKNSGEAPAIGKICYEINTQAARPEDQRYCKSSSGIDVNIAPGASWTVPNEVIPLGGPYHFNVPFAKKNRYASVSFRVVVVPFSQIVESNSDNNFTKQVDVLTWPKIMIRLSDKNGDHPDKLAGTVVVLDRIGSSSSSRRQVAYTKQGSITGAVAFFAPADSYRGSTFYYSAYAARTGHRFSSSATPQVYSESSFNIEFLTITANSAVELSFCAKYDYVHSSSDGGCGKPREGTVTIRNDVTGKTYSSSIVEQAQAYFDEENSGGPGKYTVVSVTAKYNPHWTEYSYVYPEPTRSADEQRHAEGYRFEIVKDDMYYTNTIFIFLRKQCESIPRTSSRYCVYGQKSVFDKVTREDMPVAAEIIQRENRWTYGLGGKLKTVIYSPPDPAVSAGGYYSNGSEIVINVLTKNSASLFAKNIFQHEAFHAIDEFAGRPSNTPEVIQNVDTQFNTSTGQALWNLAFHPYAYDSSLYGYDSGGILKADTKYHEVLAEERTAACMFGTQMKNRLNNIEVAWQNKYHTTPPPNLISQRDNVLKRLKGTLPNSTATNTKLSYWFSQCPL